MKFNLQRKKYFFYLITFEYIFIFLNLYSFIVYQLSLGISHNDRQVFFILAMIAFRTFVLNR